MPEVGHGEFIPDLLALMPLSAREVLICGPGELARAYRLRNPLARLTGCGAQADAGFDRFIEGDPGTIGKARLAVPGLGYDLVALDATLGGMRDPGAFLRRLHALIRPGGHLVAANPHAGYWRDIARLVSGEPVAGDRMTQDALEDLLREAGFALRRVRGVRDQEKDMAAEKWLPELGRLAAAVGIEPGRHGQRIRVSDLVAVATRPGPAPVAPTLSIHQFELARGMDARTRVPAQALATEPGLNITRIQHRMEIPQAGPRGAIAILQRPRLSDPRRMLEFTAACQRRGIVVVVEYDDDPSLVARVLPREDVPAIYARNLALAHAVQTSTGVLAQQFARANPEVMVFPNCAEDLPPPRVHQPGPMRVLCAALNRRDMAAMAALLAPAIKALPDLEFDVIHERALFDALPTLHKRFHEIKPYREYLALVGQADVALMPLEGLPDELGKSDVKWVEAASRGAVAIASPPVYGQTIRHGENGFLVRAPGDWSALLIELAGDPGLRARAAAAARDEVLRDRMMAGQVAARRDWYLDLHARREALFAAAVQRSPDLAALLGVVRSSTL